MDGDIESNSRPKTKTKKQNFFSCCHWNLNSLLAQKFFKLCFIMIEKKSKNNTGIIIERDPRKQTTATL